MELSALRDGMPMYAIQGVITPLLLVRGAQARPTGKGIAFPTTGHITVAHFIGLSKSPLESAWLEERKPVRLQSLVIKCPSILVGIGRIETSLPLPSFFTEIWPRILSYLDDYVQLFVDLPERLPLGRVIACQRSRLVSAEKHAIYARLSVIGPC